MEPSHLGGGAGRDPACHCVRGIDRQDARRPHRLEACAPLRMALNTTSGRDKPVDPTARLRDLPLYSSEQFCKFCLKLSWSSKELIT